MSAENQEVDGEKSTVTKPSSFSLLKEKLLLFGQKIKLDVFLSRLSKIDFNDKKNLFKLIIAIIALVLLIVFFAVSSLNAGKGELSVISDDSVFNPGKVLTAVDSYITLLPDKDAKEREVMATIKGEEKGSTKVLRFSLSLGVSKKILEEDIRNKMAPLMSETLRFLSQRTEEQIINMIQERTTDELIRELNSTLRREGVDTNAKGIIVNVSFTTYFFVSI